MADQSIHRFIYKHGITLSSRPAPGPVGGAGGWGHRGTHWSCTLGKVYDDRCWLFTPFHMGSAHRDEPKVADVLDSLASDVRSYIGVSFEDWCTEFGYDTYTEEDTKGLAEARQIYHEVGREYDKLLKFLGADALDELLYHTEPL